MFKKLFSGLLVALAIFLIIGLVFGEDEETVSEVTDTDASTTETKEEVKKEEPVKTEFAVGETASYEGYEVTINSVEFSKGDDWNTPESGKEFVVVNLTITNNTDDTASFNPYDFQLNDNGVKTDMNVFVTFLENELSSGELDVGASVTGNICGEGNPANPLKLEYETSFWSDETVDFLLN